MRGRKRKDGKERKEFCLQPNWIEFGRKKKKEEETKSSNKEKSYEKIYTIK